MQHRGRAGGHEHHRARHILRLNRNPGRPWPGLGRPFGEGTSFTCFLFQDPLARQHIVNWETFTAASVAALRREVRLVA